MNAFLTAVTWLSQNLAAMIAAAAIMTLGVLVYATSTSVTRLDSQVRTVSSAVDQLHSGVRTLSESNAKPEGLMRASEAGQKELGKSLSEQANAGLTTARELQQATKLLGANARMTGELLDDNLKRIDEFEITIDVKVDPYQLVDATTRAQLEKDLQVAAGDPLHFDLERARGTCTKLDRFTPPLPWLVEHDDDVRRQILERWHVVVLAAPGVPPPPSARPSSSARPQSAPALDAVARFDREGGVESMSLNGVVLCEGPPAYLMALYEVHYRVPTKPVGGLRTYEDFLGGTVIVGMNTTASLMAPDELSLRLGVRGESWLEAKVSAPLTGDWEAKFEIPSDYLKRAGAGPRAKPAK